MSAQTTPSAIRRGVALFRAQRYDQAAAELDWPARLEHDPLAWRYLAASLHAGGRSAEALATLGEALLSWPDAAWPWHHLAAALHAQQRDDEATLAEHEAALACSSPGASPPAEPLWDEDPRGATEQLGQLGVLALGLLRRAQPVSLAGWRVVLGGLGRLVPAAAAERLHRLAESGDGESRRWAAELAGGLLPALGDRGDDLALSLAADDEPAVRSAVRPALLARAEDQPALMERLLTTGDAEARHETVAAVAASGDAEPLRRVYSQSEDAKVRRECLRGFGQTGQSDLLTMVLWDENGALRAEAARLLAAQGATEAAQTLRERADQEADEHVRAAFASAAASLSAAAAAQELDFVPPAAPDDQRAAFEDGADQEPGA